MSDVYDVLNKQSKEKFHSTVIETLARRGIKARTMISKPIGGLNRYPKYGTILRNKIDEHAMYLGRILPDDPVRIPGNAMVVLDDSSGTYIHQCTDMQLMKQWEIVSEIDL